MSDSQIIDSGALDRLRDWGGAKLIAQMLRLFLDNSGKRMDQIRSGLGGDGLQEAERGAHSLKSSAANVGAERVRSLSAELESAASTGDTAAAVQIMVDLEAAHTQALSELEVAHTQALSELEATGQGSDE